MRRESQYKMWSAVTFWFLVLSYVIGSPAFAIIEARSGIFSEKFDYPAVFLYLVSAAQLVCALTLFWRRIARWGLVVLTVISLGAVASHFRIDSPVTSLPAVAYTVVQAWYWFYLWRQDQSFSTR